MSNPRSRFLRPGIPGHGFILLTVIALGAVTGCQAPAATPDAEPAGGRPEASAPETNPAVPAGAQTLDTVSFMFEAATEACARDDARAFIQAIAFSPEVARRFMATAIDRLENGTSRRVSADAYGDLPIAMIDYSWVTRASARRVIEGQSGELEHVTVEINQSSDNRIVVDWVPVSGGPAPGDDPSGAEPKPVGPGGSLLFHPTDDCWTLVQDRREPLS